LELFIVDASSTCSVFPGVHTTPRSVCRHTGADAAFQSAMNWSWIAVSHVEIWNFPHKDARYAVL